ncbi:unnamed protein product [Debaryomyces fabryi]|nr:unnamed protein product [Debaryomyces fabryi]
MLGPDRFFVQYDTIYISNSLHSLQLTLNKLKSKTNKNCHHLAISWNAQQQCPSEKNHRIGYKNARTTHYYSSLIPHATYKPWYISIILATDITLWHCLTDRLEDTGPGKRRCTALRRPSIYIVGCEYSDIFVAMTETIHKRRDIIPSQQKVVRFTTFTTFTTSNYNHDII